MTTLYVAAGGGGDALGALLARRALGDDVGTAALVSTCAWERLRVDPVPGPRSRAGFIGLGRLGGEPVEILSRTDTIPPGLSMLPRLAEQSDARLFLHDFDGGVARLTSQLQHLAEALDVDQLVVVDVGGDIIATGSEPTLLSPLADALTLAAALAVGRTVTVVVVGPGTDAELPEVDVTERLRQLGAECSGTVTPDDVARLSRVLAWHPTEATTLVAASALGVRGSAAMRRGAPTPITDHGAEVWTLYSASLDDFPLARALNSTESLDEAEGVMREHAVDELDYERERAQRRTVATPSRPLHEVALEALALGATHITMRRLAEVAGETNAEAAHDVNRPGGIGLWALDDLVLAAPPRTT